MRDRDHGAEAGEELLEPLDRLRIEVVQSGSSNSMSGLDRRSLHSATRRFSPPERCSMEASHGGRRSASAAISTRCRRRRSRRSPRAAPAPRRLLHVGVGLAVGGVDLLEPLLRRAPRPARTRPRRAPVLSPSTGSAAGSRLRMPAWRVVSPSNSSSTPAMIRSTVDLPEPFRPSRPIFAPWKKERRCP